MIFGLGSQLLCTRAVIETQAFLLIRCSELHHDHQQTLWLQLIDVHVMYLA